MSARMASALFVPSLPLAGSKSSTGSTIAAAPVPGSLSRWVAVLVAWSNQVLTCGFMRCSSRAPILTRCGALEEGLRSAPGRRLHDADVELAQLLHGDRARRVHHQILGLLVHREEDDLADVRLAGEQHDDAVDAGGGAAVRRRAIFEGADH